MLNKILVVCVEGNRNQNSNLNWSFGGPGNDFGIGVSVCACVLAIGRMPAYSGASLLQPATGTDQMDDQTLIIPSRPIPSKAVINFAELHQI